MSLIQTASGGTVLRALGAALCLALLVPPGLAQESGTTIAAGGASGNNLQETTRAVVERLAHDLHDAIQVQEPHGGALQGELVIRIIRGDLVSAADQMRLGLVSINMGGCSGTLLRNDWAITAGHCFAAGLPRAATVTLNGVTVNSSEIYVFGRERLPGGGNDLRGPDVALIHTAVPFTINGSTTAFRTDVDRTDALDLRNRVVIVYGQGLNTLTTPGAPASGGGVFRVGIMEILPSINNFRQDLLEAKPIFNPGPVCFFGDSGGPMFVSEPGGLQLVSVVQTGDMSCPPPGPCTPANVTEVRSCIGPKVFDMWEAIPDIIATRWNAADETALFDVGGAEWVATATINGSIDTDEQPWAAAARSANEMCFNRGYVGGLMNGHQLNFKFGLACSGFAGAQWRDATSAEINGTPWPFADVNTASWAQANRAAARLCEQDGFVGGHFNGNMAPNPAGGLLMGLVCYRGGARRFDVPPTDLNANFATPDVVPWAEARRRANNLCQLRGFKTGFLNGHFFPNGTMGLICH